MKTRNRVGRVYNSIKLNLYVVQSNIALFVEYIALFELEGVIEVSIYQ